MTIVVQKHIVQWDILETKTNEFQEQLQKWRTDISTCDKKMAELEAFKVEIEKNIAAYQTNKTRHNECLAKEVSIAEKLRQTLAKTRNDVKKTALEAIDKILEYQRTLLDIACLGHRI